MDRRPVDTLKEEMSDRDPEGGERGLPTTLLSHLDAIDPPALRLVVREGKLWFWSEQRWRAGQLERYLQMAKAIEDRSRNSGAR